MNLEISWEDALEPNTTYQFNFGKSIIDLNEGNVNPNLNYVFSTGDYIDSLTIYGHVVTADDNEPLVEAAVMIYTSFEDSMPTTAVPDYFALTDQAGNFKLQYLPTDEYKIFVLFEENNNYIYDGPPERIGFMDQTVESSANDSSATLNFLAFIENDTSQYISSSKGRDFGRYELVFNVPAENASIQFFDTETNEKYEAKSFLNSRKDSLSNWVSIPRNRIVEEITVITSDGAFVDTSFWYLEPDLKYREKAVIKISSNTTRNRLNLSHQFTLKINNPLVEADTSLIYFLEDSIQVYPTDFQRSDVNRKFVVSYPFKAESSYIFKAKAGAFRDVFEAFSDSISIPFSLQDGDFYGDLTLDVKLNETTEVYSESKLIQLYTSKNKLIKQIPFTASFSTEFNQLDPGKYILKVVFDANGDGKWNTGDYLNNIQPERISIYPEEIQIRSNWELEIDWEPSMPF